MTPPPAATYSASSPAVGVPVPGLSRARVLGSLVDARSWRRLRFLVDVVVLGMAAIATLFLNAGRGSQSSNRLLAVAFPLLVLVILHARRSPDDRLHGSRLDTGINVLGVVSLSAMLLVAVESMLGITHSLALALHLWIFSLLYLGIARVALLSVRQRAVRNAAFSIPTLIVGAGTVGERLVKRLTGDPRYGLRPVGFLDHDPMPRPTSARELPVPVLGSHENLADAIEQTGARHVILAFSTESDRALVEKVRLCQQLGVDVALVPRLYEAINDRSTLDHIGGLPLVSLRPTDPRGLSFAVKHVIDRGVAALTLLVAAPLMLSIAVALKLTSPGPILFRQRRVGRDGHEFDLLKFRTMRDGFSEGPTVFDLRDGCAPGGVEGIDRRTWLGRRLRRLSLDELPQFINVLAGDMSLVGPRPERPRFVELFTAELDRYGDRHRVKSGITGWAQVNGLRGQTSIADRVEWDNYYIQNWSLRLDLRILLLTVAEVLRFRG